MNSDILITIVVIVLAALLIVVLPVMTMADRFDTTSQAEVEAIVSNFVEEARTKKVVTQEGYAQFKENLGSLGYTFDVNVELKSIDENPGKKTLQTTKDKIGENGYVSAYTTQFEEQLEKSGKIKLNTGDMILVSVVNANPTFAQQLKNFAYKITGNDSATIIASKAGMVQ